MNMQDTIAKLNASTERTLAKVAEVRADTAKLHAFAEASSAAQAKRAIGVIQPPSSTLGDSGDERHKRPSRWPSQFRRMSATAIRAGARKVVGGRKQEASRPWSGSITIEDDRRQSPIGRSSPVANDRKHHR